MFMILKPTSEMIEQAHYKARKGSSILNLHSNKQSH